MSLAHYIFFGVLALALFAATSGLWFDLLVWLMEWLDGH
jgi:hypothetical protein